MERTKDAAHLAHTPTPSQPLTLELALLRISDGLDHVKISLDALRAVSCLTEVTQRHSEQSLSHLHRNDLTALLEIIRKDMDSRLSGLTQDMSDMMP